MDVRRMILILLAVAGMSLVACDASTTEREDTYACNDFFITPAEEDGASPTVTIDSTIPENARIVKYKFDFGNGEQEEVAPGNSLSPLYTDASPGSYTLSVTIVVEKPDGTPVVITSPACQVVVNVSESSVSVSD